MGEGGGGRRGVYLALIVSASDSVHLTGKTWLGLGVDDNGL